MYLHLINSYRRAVASALYRKGIVNKHNKKYVNIAWIFKTGT